MSRTIKTGVVALLLAVGGALAVAAPASATDPTPCDNGPKTVVTHVTDHPDGGHGNGTWALDTFDRTVVTSKVAAVQPQVATADKPAVWSYQAQVKDTGTFITKAGSTLSPNKGEALVGGVKGTMNGSFTVDFTAPACFAGYTGKLGNPQPNTSNWVPALWDGKITITTNLDANYKWTYTTCSESWLDAYNNKDGQADGAGDITGKPCPSASPSTPASGGAGGGAQTSSSASTSAAASLPVTGSSASTLAIAGVSALVIGIVAVVSVFVARRRRRTEFVA